MLKGLPWSAWPKEREVMAAPMPIEVPDAAAPAVAAPPVPVAFKDVATALCVKRADIDEFGMWPGCKGRPSLATGMHQQAHSIDSRVRTQEEPMKTAAGDSALRGRKRGKGPKRLLNPL
eukprot:3032808-Pyramimonas_sp.AAC.1